MPPRRRRDPAQPAPMPTRASARLARRAPGPQGPTTPPPAPKRRVRTAAPAAPEEKLREEPPRAQTPPPPPSPQTPNWSFSLGSLFTGTVRRVTSSFPFPRPLEVIRRTATPTRAVTLSPSPPNSAPAQPPTTRKGRTPMRPSGAQLPPAKRMSQKEKAKLAYEERDRPALKKLMRKAFTKDVLAKVPKEDQELASNWLEMTLKTLKLEHLWFLLGNPSDRYDFPRVDDMESIPAHPPWKSGFGCFGLSAGFYDFDSDIDQTITDDELPNELPLVWKMEQLANPIHKRPIKRRKTTHLTSTPIHSTTTDIPATGHVFKHKQAMASTTNTPTTKPVFTNSFGTSASPRDLQPRSAVVPSPMFDGNGEYQGGNIFDHERVASTPVPVISQPVSTVPITGTYGLFDDDEDFVSDDEDTPSKTPAVASTTPPASPKKTSAVASTTPSVSPSKPTSTPAVTAPAAPSSQPSWTQSPPPAPIPAHAELPVVPTPPRPQASATTSAPTPPTTAGKGKRKFSTHQDYAPARPSPLRQEDTVEAPFGLYSMPTPPSDDSDQSGSTPPKISDLGGLFFGGISFPESP